MNILLVNPSQSNVYGGLVQPEHPPIGLAYVGAVLERAGHSVKIIDIDADKITPEDLVGRVERESVSLVGIMALTPTFNNAVATAKIIKEKTGALVVLGGVHATLMPEECIKSEPVDFVVVGEGEETAVELVKTLEADRDFSKIRGLAYKDSTGIYVNQRRALIEDLDSLPPPAMHLFNNTTYTYPDALYHPTFPIVTSRGCPGRCTYCNTQNIFSTKFRARSAANIADEIEHLIAKYGAKEIHIWDDNFATLKRRVFEVRDEIKKRGIKTKFAFPNGLRVDFLSRDVLEALKEMGTYSLAVGVESANPEILSRIKKNIKLSTVREVVANAKELGLETWAFFMMGLPGEDRKSVEMTIDFAVELNPDIAKFHILKPFPGTEAYEDLFKRGLIDVTDFSKYGIHTPPVHHLEKMSADEIMEMQNVAYRRFYLRPSKIAQQIFRIRSWNRFKLNATMGFSLLRKILSGK